MKKIIVDFSKTKATKRKSKILGMSHPGCCAQGGGCPKKHG
jgi:hypothetical protein